MGIDPVQLTRQLIDIPSPTGEEQDVALFLEEFLRELGFSCRKHYIGEDRFNLVATASDEPRVLFCTHL
ncbi:MAG: peptidase dimerization protein, partial [Thermoanaerobaculia bacterium]|nr:peptidase dimerization protein [Thermoanaerobaculia bacterium]